jgi:hypothetical protein
MFFANMKLLALGVLATGLLGTGLSRLAYQGGSAQAGQGKSAEQTVVASGQTTQIGQTGKGKQTESHPQTAAVDKAAKNGSDAQGTPGMLWETRPKQGVFSGHFTSGKVLGIIGTDAKGAVLVTLSYPVRARPGNSSLYKPVAIGKNDKRYPFQQTIWLRNDELICCQYRLDPTIVPLDQVSRVGVEEVP